MRIGSLFSGYGGLDIAVAAAAGACDGDGLDAEQAAQLAIDLKDPRFGR